MERADWSSIFGDILCLVAEKIDLVQDYVNLCAVCRNWYFIATDFHRLTKKPNIVAPYCMLRARGHTHSRSDPESDSKFRFQTYDPDIREKEIVLELPELSGRKCWGSPFGWIVTFCPIDFEFSLLYPFSRETLRLPSLWTLTKIGGSKYDPYKALLIADPDDSPDNCIVVLVVHVDKKYSILAFARPGDDAWSRIQGSRNLNDVIYFKGKLYGVRRNRDHTPLLVLICIDQPYPRTVKIHMSSGNGKVDFSASHLYGVTSDVKYITRRYLVDLDGELCLVIRYVTLSCITVSFKIFKINLSTKKWKFVPSLGDRCLFVGNNYTFTCKATSRQDKFKNPPDNFISDYIFYTPDDDYTFYRKIEVHYFLGEFPPMRHDDGIFQIMPDKFTYIVQNFLMTYPQLWIMRSLRFRRLKQIDVTQEDAMIVDFEQIHVPREDAMMINLE